MQVKEKGKRERYEEQEREVPTSGHVGNVTGGGILGHDKDVGGGGIAEKVEHTVQVLVFGDGDEGLLIAGKEILDGHGIGIAVEHISEFGLEIDELGLVVNVKCIGVPSRVGEGPVFVGHEFSS